jgi:hypothetical protein
MFEMARMAREIFLTVSPMPGKTLNLWRIERLRGIGSILKRFASGLRGNGRLSRHFKALVAGSGPAQPMAILTLLDA